MKLLCLWIALFFVNCTCYALKVREVLIKDLPAIQTKYGSDSVRALIHDTPIWRANQPVALQLLNGLPDKFAQSSWGRRYLESIGIAIKAPELARLLEKVMDDDVAAAEQVSAEHMFVFGADEDVILAYLHQETANAEAVFESQLERYLSVKHKLVSMPRDSFFKRFFEGDPVLLTKKTVDETIYKVLLVLNKLDAAKYPQRRLDEQRIQLDPWYTVNNLKYFPVGREWNYKSEIVAFEKLSIGGIIIPKLSVSENYNTCAITKIVESEQLYFVEEACYCGPRCGRGNTYMVKVNGDSVDLTYVNGWVS
ncbi:hypothetical protein [Hymenobacter negativus]|uniref:Uncharacterized protein n=1 Tax=Hymenobacter negativus TaxID=2795026 RepID=A0ABS0Q3R0_9BACT|nr:hypothetical protein [Hymenobacter negativus]MBH8557279.1 hypothetical protein [Hymenobacter negativus]